MQLPMIDISREISSRLTMGLSGVMKMAVRRINSSKILPDNINATNDDDDDDDNNVRMISAAAAAHDEQHARSDRNVKEITVSQSASQ